MRFERQISEMHGVFSAIFTPYDASGQIDLDMLRQIAEFQLQGGLRGFFVTGSTGECLLLDYRERLAVIRHLVQVTGDRATIIAHVGHPSTDYAVRLARDAAGAGANWIASVAPIYYGTTFQGALRHYRAISEATDLPFMLYSLGEQVDPLRDAAFFELPNVCGMKYTGANFFSVQQLVRNVHRPVALMSGFDEQFVAGQCFGFHGGIGSTYNFAPRYYADIYRHFQAGEIARASALQAEINQVTQLMVQYENWSYRKAIMKYIGLDCGWYRAPYAPLSEQEFADFAARLDELGVLRRGEAARTRQASAAPRTVDPETE
jgi:N-acetylneuraminate lyase